MSDLALNIDDEFAERKRISLFERAYAVLTPLRLTRAQAGRAWEAFQAFPDGVTRIAREAECGRVPAALFMAKLTAGDHELPPHKPKPRPTGWRFQRGSHGGTYVEDPEGMDTPPPGYFTTPGGSSTRHVEKEPERLDLGERL